MKAANMTQSRKLWIVAGVLVLALFAWWFLRSPTPMADDPAVVTEKADAGSPASDVLTLTPEQIRVAGLEFVQVSGASAQSLTFPGTVRAAPTGIARLDARASGTVRRVLKTLGDPVRRGEAVAIIESAEASDLSAQRAAAQARVTELQSSYTREQRLYDAKVTARQDLEAARANLSVARAELERTRSAIAAAGVTGDGRSITVTSALSGRITAAPVVLGSFVTAGEELFSVVDPASLQVEVALPAAQGGRIAPGDTASVDVPGGGQVTARVRSVTPSLDAESRSATAVLTLRGTVPGLQPNAFVEVRISPSGAVRAKGVSVPEDAVQTIAGRTVVFVRTKDGVRVQPVQVGERGDGRSTILSGLAVGQTIVGANAFLLKAQIEKGAGDDDE